MCVAGGVDGRQHPDKNAGSEAAKTKFQALGIVHSVLKDDERRAMFVLRAAPWWFVHAMTRAYPCCAACRSYDECGEFEDDVTADASAKEAEWQDYWRTLFPQVTAKSISAFYESYRHSEEEKADVLRSYVRHKGDMEAVLAETMCCSESDEERFCELVSQAIASNAVKRFKAFTKVWLREGRVWQLSANAACHSG